MKRDMDLCRKILLEVEKASYEGEDGIFDFKVEEYDRDEVSYHLLLLDEARLIEARNLNRNIEGFWFLSDLLGKVMNFWRRLEITIDGRRLNVLWLKLVVLCLR